MRLGDLAHSRDNNLNLIRLLAAAAVLITHAHALSTGDPRSEPLRQHLGTTMGNIAVDIFFIVSGFLVTQGLIARNSVIDFIWARVLRIAPALVALMLLSVFVLGPICTTLRAADYFSAPGTWVYLVKGLTIFHGVAFDLPGVFERNPYPRTVNGSLWTLVYEVRMYALLLGLFVASHACGARRWLCFSAAVHAITAASAALFLYSHLHHTDPLHSGLCFMFFSGVSIRLLENRWTLDASIFCLLMGLLFMSSVNAQSFLLVYCFSLAPIVMFLAYRPAGALRAYSRVGDYSYGLYIYAFPVQQVLAAVFPGIGIASLVLSSATAAAALAVLSWHAIEKPALQLKPWAVRRTYQWLLGTS